MERIGFTAIQMSAPSRIQAVSFDVGGTLIEPWPSVGHVYAEIAAKHGLNGLSTQLLNERFKAAWRTCRDFDYTRAGWEILVNQTFAGLTDSCAHFFPELYERFAEPEAWRIFDDVQATLDSLASRDIRLVIVSNWDERLRVLLQRLRLQNYFETLVISCEVGFAKPSPVIFEQAATKLGLPRHSILHVGDSLEMDVQGARAAGLEALHLRRAISKAAPGEIGSLAELPMNPNTD